MSHVASRQPLECAPVDGAGNDLGQREDLGRVIGNIRPECDDDLSHVIAATQRLHAGQDRHLGSHLMRPDQTVDGHTQTEELVRANPSAKASGEVVDLASWSTNRIFVGMRRMYPMPLDEVEVVVGSDALRRIAGGSVADVVGRLVEQMDKPPRPRPDREIGQRARCLSRKGREPARRLQEQRAPAGPPLRSRSRWEWEAVRAQLTQAAAHRTGVMSLRGAVARIVPHGETQEAGVVAQERHRTRHADRRRGARAPDPRSCPAP